MKKATEREVERERERKREREKGEYDRRFAAGVVDDSQRVIVTIFIAFQIFKAGKE